MIAECTRQVADVFNDPGHGILAQLANLVAHGGVEAGDVVPDTLSIASEADDDNVAHGSTADGEISLGCFFEGLSKLPEASQRRQRHFHATVAFRIDAGGSAGAEITAIISLVQRAALRVLEWWEGSGTLAGYVERNQIQFLAIAHVEAAAFAPTVESANNTYGGRVVLEIHDAIPLL